MMIHLGTLHISVKYDGNIEYTLVAEEIEVECRGEVRCKMIVM